MEFLFVVRYGVRKGNPPWWSTLAVAADDEREARSIALRMAALHKTDILSFEIRPR